MGTLGLSIIAGSRDARFQPAYAHVFFILGTPFVPRLRKDDLHGGRSGLTYLGLLNRRAASRAASAAAFARHYNRCSGAERAAEKARHPTLTLIWEEHKLAIRSVALSVALSVGAEPSALQALQTAVLGPLNIFAGNSAVEDSIKRVKATVKVSQKAAWHQIEASLRFSKSRTDGVLMPPKAEGEPEAAYAAKVANVWRQAVKRAKAWQTYERAMRERKNEALRHSVQTAPLSQAQLTAYAEGVHGGGLSYATRAQQAQQVLASTQPPQPPPSPTVGPTPEATGSQPGPQGPWESQPTPTPP